MKLATFTVPGDDEPLSGAVVDDRVVAFADGARVVDVLARGGAAPMAEKSWPLSEVTLLAPVPDAETQFSNYFFSAFSAPSAFQKLPARVSPASPN